VADVEAVMAVCERESLAYEVTTERPRDDWTYRTVSVRSPNSWDVQLEEESKDS